MPRPFKSGVDFFPLDVVMDDKVKILEAEQDIVGFAIWVKLHQKVYAHNYWINWDKKAKIVFSSEINVDINKVNDVINSCLEWKIFDNNVFEKYSVLTSRGIQKRYFYICKKRLKLEIVKEYTLIEVPKIAKQEIIIVDINSVNEAISTQSKVNEKESDSKENEKVNNIVEYLNKKLGTNFKNTSSKTVSCITARLNEKYTEKDFETVIDKKYNDWFGTDSAKYLRPETLFGNKFDGYLNQIDGKQKTERTPEPGESEVRYPNGYEKQIPIDESYEFDFSHE